MVESWERVLATELARRGEPLCADTKEALANLLTTAAAAWPDIALPAAAFARHLAARCDDAAPLVATMTKLHVGDLFLAAACAARLPSALTAFTAHHLSCVGLHLSRLRPSEAFVADVQQVVAERLLVGATPKIADYSGRGPLGAWVRIIALRTALDLSRRRAEQPPPLQLVPPPLGDPELDYLRQRYREHFRQAFSAAVTSLPGETRNLLRLHFVESISLEALAPLFRVHRMTLHRRVKDARRRILAEAQRLLREQLHLRESECESLLRLLHSDLDLTLSSLLAP
jgi:RNA polymerase sigma-70 factor (ECF subfamily)